jgi:predicted RNA-binding protein YlxR (DUF448 family)
MVRRSQRRKQVPRRTCVACRTTRPKQELVRVVRTPDGNVVLDETGKCNGRGAYLCKQRSCLKDALAHKHLERALRISISTEIESKLRVYAEGLPSAESVENDG